MQGAVFVNLFKEYRQDIVDNVLQDGKPYIIVLDGHASRVHIDVTQLADY